MQGISTQSSLDVSQTSTIKKADQKITGIHLSTEISNPMCQEGFENTVVEEQSTAILTPIISFEFVDNVNVRSLASTASGAMYEWSPEISERKK